MVGALGVVLALAFATAFSVPGLGLLGLGIYRVVAERSALSRVETVPATITRAEVEYFQDVRDMGDGEYLENTDRYQPRVAFEYEYGGRTYESNLTGWERAHGAGMSRDRAHRRIARYGPGETTTAFVDPESPSRGFLERDRGSGLLVNAFLVGFGGLFALAGFGGGFLIGAVLFVG